MSVNVNINNTSYTIPNTAEENWGDNVTNWIVAASSFLLQRSGGSFPLSSEVDFGGSAGIKLLYASTRTANPALSGVIRLSNLDTIKWRNAANSADLALQVNASNELVFDGVKIPLSGLIVNADVAPAAGIVYSKLNLAASILNSDIASGAAIDRTKLASGTNYRILANNASGVMSENAALTANQLVQADANGQLASVSAASIAQGGTGQTTQTAAFDALAPTTTKGDVIVHNGSDNVRQAVGTDGHVLTADSAEPTGVKWAPASATTTDSSYDIVNLGLTVAASANTMVINVVTKAGATPSPTSPVKVGFRDSSLTSGLYNVRTLTSSLSLTIPTGATLGSVDAQPQQIYVYLVDNGGTLSLAAASTTFDEGQLQTVLAMTSGSDNLYNLYGTSVAGVPVRLIGKFTSTQTTAGTYAANPTAIAVVPFKPEYIHANYKLTAGSVSTGGNVIVDYDTRVEDTHNAVTRNGMGSWQFTAPRTAVYLITAQVQYVGTTWAAGTAANIELVINSSMYETLDVENVLTTAGVNMNLSGSVAVLIPLGQSVWLTTFQNQGSTLSLDTTGNRITITSLS